MTASAGDSSSVARHQSGRTIVVTGGGSGIGAATCREAARRGALVVVLDRDEAAAEEVAASCGQAHASGGADVTDEDAIRSALLATLPEDREIDGVVTCAGIVSSQGVEGISTDLASALVATNLLGTFHTVRAALPLMRHGSAVVTLASVAAHRGGGFFGGSMYAATKAGVIGLTRGLARELAPRGIRVNCIAPGPVRTHMLSGLTADEDRALSASVLMGRFAEATEIAMAILFLLSEDASFVTGEVLNVNGGAHFS